MARPTRAGALTPSVTAGGRFLRAGLRTGLGGGPVGPGEVAEHLVLLAADPALTQVLGQARPGTGGILAADLEVDVGGQAVEAVRAGQLLLAGVRDQPHQPLEPGLAHMVLPSGWVARGGRILPTGGEEPEDLLGLQSPGLEARPQLAPR